MLVSSAEYLKKYNNGELEGMKINPDLVKKEDGLLGTPSLKKTEIKTTINSEINIQKSSVPKGRRKLLVLISFSFINR